MSMTLWVLFFSLMILSLITSHPILFMEYFTQHVPVDYYNLFSVFLHQNTFNISKKKCRCTCLPPFRSKSPKQWGCSFQGCFNILYYKAKTNLNAENSERFWIEAITDDWFCKISVGYALEYLTSLPGCDFLQNYHLPSSFSNRMHYF